jgi:hypothetical protein
MVSSVNHNCCHPQKGCQKRPESVSDCVTLPARLAIVEQFSAPVLVSLPVFHHAWNFEPQHLGGEALPPNPVIQSPPELFLLHSALTI